MKRDITEKTDTEDALFKGKGRNNTRISLSRVGPINFHGGHASSAARRSGQSSGERRFAPVIGSTRSNAVRD